ncbi:Exosome complex component RRP42 [Saguinus oedipus]|uniref:Ribosomal RNA-processing protein 42 n=1 Tax=Saguinus oedipus TaxID=9490 RepID=A0ABQ9U1Q6_SAGOE|nr:Exosome complex component RRP42 [Saguinus oedipus]
MEEEDQGLSLVFNYEIEQAVSFTVYTEDLRVDGRGCEDYRCVEVETDVVSNTSGSARVKLGHTDILVGVKAEMGMPKLEKPNEGYLEFFVDWQTKDVQFNHTKERVLPSDTCSANATPEFEGRGGDDLGTEIANTLYRIFNNKSSVDLKTLCISPREHCWVLYVDVLMKAIRELTVNFIERNSLALHVGSTKTGGAHHKPRPLTVDTTAAANCDLVCMDHLLECDGNLFDAISIAVKASLFNTRPRTALQAARNGDSESSWYVERLLAYSRIPRVRVLEDEEGSKDIELSDDPYDCIRLSVENVPCIVTLCKIGYRHVVDATLQEEACSLASLLVSVTSKGVVTCLRKVGKGSLDPESIFEMMEVRPWFRGWCGDLARTPAASCPLGYTMGILPIHILDFKPGAWRTVGVQQSGNDSVVELRALGTSKRVGKVLHASLQSILHKEESLGPKRQKVGFLG